MVHVLRAF